ncbi:hypothetical protein J8273_1403 [Carpediemonas membranifera]|uniref:Uncharacterized protein n=1 Tax=Carpediemonas membranifera TaxID=201153 RepID=A0A8J6E4K1_9EUKA|nr:hypothetical protein J8273_1403 [Carpediemonas membranifera]|eukprot:KAG9397046.1 hypothetical protein J8273_1403 [Carpediemonas membranifera]
MQIELSSRLADHRNVDVDRQVIYTDFDGVPRLIHTFVAAKYLTVVIWRAAEKGSHRYELERTVYAQTSEIVDYCVHEGQLVILSDRNECRGIDIATGVVDTKWNLPPALRYSIHTGPGAVLAVAIHETTTTLYRLDRDVPEPDELVTCPYPCEQVAIVDMLAVLLSNPRAPSDAESEAGDDVAELRTYHLENESHGIVAQKLPCRGLQVEGGLVFTLGLYSEDMAILFVYRPTGDLAEPMVPVADIPIALPFPTARCWGVCGSTFVLSSEGQTAAWSYSTDPPTIGTSPLSTLSMPTTVVPAAGVVVDVAGAVYSAETLEQVGQLAQEDPSAGMLTKIVMRRRVRHVVARGTRLTVLEEGLDLTAPAPVTAMTSMSPHPTPATRNPLTGFQARRGGRGDSSLAPVLVLAHEGRVTLAVLTDGALTPVMSIPVGGAPQLVATGTSATVVSGVIVPEHLAVLTQGTVTLYHANTAVRPASLSDVVFTAACAIPWDPVRHPTAHLVVHSIADTIIGLSRPLDCSDSLYTSVSWLDDVPIPHTRRAMLEATRADLETRAAADGVYPGWHRARSGVLQSPSASTPTGSDSKMVGRQRASTVTAHTRPRSASIRGPGTPRGTGAEVDQGAMLSCVVPSGSGMLRLRLQGMLSQLGQPSQAVTGMPRLDDSTESRLAAISSILGVWLPPEEDSPDLLRLPRDFLKILESDWLTVVRIHKSPRIPADTGCIACSYADRRAQYDTIATVIRTALAFLSFKSPFTRPDEYPIPGPMEAPDCSLLVDLIAGHVPLLTAAATYVLAVARGRRRVPLPVHPPSEQHPTLAVANLLGNMLIEGDPDVAPLTTLHSSTREDPGLDTAILVASVMQGVPAMTTVLTAMLRRAVCQTQSAFAVTTALLGRDGRHDSHALVSAAQSLLRASNEPDDRKRGMMLLDMICQRDPTLHTALAVDVLVRNGLQLTDRMAALPLIDGNTAMLAVGECPSSLRVFQLRGNFRTMLVKCWGENDGPPLFVSVCDKDKPFILAANNTQVAIVVMINSNAIILLQDTSVDLTNSDIRTMACRWRISGKRVHVVLEARDRPLWTGEAKYKR